MIIKINNININHKIQGEGEDVIILHGWGANINTVMAIVDAIKGKYRVHAIDLPGFGESEKPHTAIDGFEYAEIIRKYMDKKGIEKAILIGHSFGGKLSIILGSKYPERVEKIILINSAGLIPKRGIKYYLKVYSFKTLKLVYKSFIFWENDDIKMERFYKRFGSTDYKDADGVMRAILVKVVNENLEKLLSSIKAPTLIIWGDKDTATPLYMGVKMEKEISDSGLVVLKGTGHYSYLDDYIRFKAVLRSFLDYN